MKYSFTCHYTLKTYTQNQVDTISLVYKILQKCQIRYLCSQDVTNNNL